MTPEMQALTVQIGRQVAEAENVLLQRVHAWVLSHHACPEHMAAFATEFPFLDYWYCPHCETPAQHIDTLGGMQARHKRCGTSVIWTRSGHPQPPAPEAGNPCERT